MNNIFALKEQLKNLQLDFLILPNNDEFADEYLPESEKRLEFITGFSGSNAIIVLGQKKSAFFTDGRYVLQAANEVDSKQFEIYNLAEKSVLKWLLENCETSDKIGFDPKLHSKNNISFYQKYLPNQKIILLEKNPVDLIWKDKPNLPKTSVFLHEEKYSGENYQQKCQKIIHDFDLNSEVLILNSPPEICWLFNIRASDIEFTPLALCYALIYKNGEGELFIDEKRLNSEVKNYLSKVKILPPEKLSNHLQNLKIKTIQLDPDYCNYWIYSQLKNFNIIEKLSPCLIHKAIKNRIEIKGMIDAHILDGIAVTKFLCWLDQNPHSDEISASQKLLEFRKLNPDFIYPSFETISGFGENGAIVHYRVNPKTNKKFGANNLYLVDSGGQYFCGTTDITRTILIGKANEEQIENFTRVLKGHISLARAKFPIGTAGGNLDILARYHLWQDFKDYDHGTGHGVGSFLSVHEGPQSISKRFNSVSLVPGMILSNEPGYYKTGKYGIRIENLVLVENSDHPQFLQFKTLTLAPIDYRLINFKMLTYPEKKWLNDYHQEILEKLSGHLLEDEKLWVLKIAEFYKLNK